MFNLKGLGCIVLATTTIATAAAEKQCLVKWPVCPIPREHFEMFVEVSMNHGGPTVFCWIPNPDDLDRSRSRHVPPTPKYDDPKVASAGRSASALSSQLALVEVGLQEVMDLKVLVYDLSDLQVGD